MPNGNDPATIRDLARLQELFSIQIAEVKNLRLEDKVSAQRALDIATAEIARRMEVLNGEAKRIQAIEAKTITREAHQLTLTPLETRVKNLETEAAELRGKADQRSVNIAVIMSVVSLAVGIISLVLKFVG